MAVLVNGGLGARSSVGVARLLLDAGIPFVLASRRGAGGAAHKNAVAETMPAVRFDWLDKSTWDAPFEYQQKQQQQQPAKALGGDVAVFSAVYIVTVPDPEIVNAFVDFAAARGVRRFVLAAGTPTVKGDPGHGGVWAHLDARGLEYCVMRPTWFMGKLPPSLPPPFKGCKGNLMSTGVASPSLASIPLTEALPSCRELLRVDPP